MINNQQPQRAHARLTSCRRRGYHFLHLYVCVVEAGLRFKLVSPIALMRPWWYASQGLEQLRIFGLCHVLHAAGKSNTFRPYWIGLTSLPLSLSGLSQPPAAWIGTEWQQSTCPRLKERETCRHSDSFSRTWPSERWTTMTTSTPIQAS